MEEDDLATTEKETAVGKKKLTISLNPYLLFTMPVISCTTAIIYNLAKRYSLKLKSQLEFLKLL